MPFTVLIHTLFMQLGSPFYCKRVPTLAIYLGDAAKRATMLGL